jgi:hypothetical protein
MCDIEDEMHERQIGCHPGVSIGPTIPATVGEPVPAGKPIHYATSTRPDSDRIMHELMPNGMHICRNEAGTIIWLPMVYAKHNNLMTSIVFAARVIGTHYHVTVGLSYGPSTTWATAKDAIINGKAVDQGLAEHLFGGIIAATHPRKRLTWSGHAEQ